MSSNLQSFFLIGNWSIDVSRVYNRILVNQIKRKGFNSCNNVGLNEEFFYFLMIFLRKESVIKGVGGKTFQI